MFEVQEYTFCDGWINTWTECDGSPSYFVTREEAQQELDNLLFDQNEAFEQGLMIDKYESENYRIVEVDNE